MDQQESKWSAFVKKMGTEYRLSILQEETFEQLTNNKLPLWKMIGALACAGLLVALTTIALLIYTPLKGPVLSFVTQIETTDIVVLNKTIDELEQKIRSRETYEKALREMLSGNLEGGLESTPSNIQASAISITNRTPSSESNVTVNLVPPISGSISATFMPDKAHYGVDIVAPKNTAVKAVMDGYVILSDWTIDTGNTIGIQHANGYVSFYKHNSSLLKKSGSPVKAGEAIAIIGNTGKLTDGPHLHFELWHHGKPINPADNINFQ